jgi:glycine oxidase
VEVKDAIIVGGGIIGCSIALRLSQAGLATSIIERGSIGCEASRAAAGMLSPQVSAHRPSPFFDLCMQSRKLYPAWAERLGALSGIDPEYQDKGTLSVALDLDELTNIEKWACWQVEAGLAVEPVSVQDLRAIEPSVTQEAVGAVRIPGDHQIENRRLMDAMEVAVRRAGIQVIQGQSVDSLLVRDSRAAGVAFGGQSLKSGVVVLAAGCWSGSMFRDAGIEVPVVPARGQMLAVKADPPPFSHVIHSGDCYLVPRRDGRIVVGSTVEYAGFHKATTAGGLHALLQAAIKLVPGLSSFEIAESWCGLRPDTPDHLPVLGPSAIENLYLATGHFRNGILLAPITAELISQCILERRVPREMSPFTAARFSQVSRTEQRDR